MEDRLDDNPMLKKTHQNATTACEESSSVPATMVLVSGLHATESTGACLARRHEEISPSHFKLHFDWTRGHPCNQAQHKFSEHQMHPWICTRIDSSENRSMNTSTFNPIEKCRKG